jgi:acyl carrier protein
MSSASNVPPQGPSSIVAEKLRRLPASAAEDFRLFQELRDEEALGRLVIAVITEHAPDKAKLPSPLEDDMRLIEDIGYDSLSIAETVFFFEDLFQISISNEEILQLRTLGDLRGFVRRKLQG